MDKIKYLVSLRSAIIASGKSEKYSIVCCNYASSLLNSNLPVLFDNSHLALALALRLLILESFFIQSTITVIMKSKSLKRMAVSVL